MSLVKTSLLNGIAVIIKVVSSLVLSKIIAAYVGPNGFAVIGQFQNAIAIIFSLSGGVLLTGVTKLTAQNFDNFCRQKKVWKSAAIITLLTSIIISTILLLTGDTFAGLFFHEMRMPRISYWLALALPIIAVGNFFIAVLNGKKEIKIYVLINILGSIVSMLIAVVLVINLGLYGALVSMVLGPAIISLLAVIIVSKSDWFKVIYFFGSMEKDALIELSGFALMGLVSALTMPTALLLIRENIVDYLGLSPAGYWQGSWKISEVYLMIITSTLSLYYLPRISEIRTSLDLIKEIRKIYSFVIPVAIVGSVSIYICRDLIITTLFSRDFLPMRDLFLWQMVGDVMKMFSWVLGYILLGRAMVKMVVITEVSFSALFYLLSLVLTKNYGLIGVSIGYACTYFCHFIVMSYVVHKEIQQMEV